MAKTKKVAKKVAPKKQPEAIKKKTRTFIKNKMQRKRFPI
jgi:hypothetical protein